MLSLCSRRLITARSPMSSIGTYVQQPSIAHFTTTAVNGVNNNNHSLVKSNHTYYGVTKENNNNYYCYLCSTSTNINNINRFYSTSTSLQKQHEHPLDAFRDSVDRQTRGMEPVGRSWSVKELRRKSYEDLHKLWYVLYKERNMLLTEQQLSRRRQLRFPQPERIKKVKKSMGAIKQVLGERKRLKIAEFHKQNEEEEVQNEEQLNEELNLKQDKERKETLA